jgi:hypothetical protein
MGLTTLETLCHTASKDISACVINKLTAENVAIFEHDVRRFDEHYRKKFNCIGSVKFLDFVTLYCNKLVRKIKMTLMESHYYDDTAYDFEQLF